MAVTKPLFINQVEYDAESERRGFGGLLAQSAAGTPRSGVLGPAPAVTLSGSTVKVGPFNAAISSAKGAYLVAVDSVTDATGTVGVADATNPRMDRVVLEILDPDNGISGGTRIGRLRVIPGQAAAIPGLPALPALALHVAQVQVPKSGGGNPVVTVDAPLTAAVGAPIPVRSQAERDAISPVVGQMVQRLDRSGALEYGSGTAWVEVGTATRSGYAVVRTNGDGYCTVPYADGPFPTATKVAIPVSMNPPAGMSLIRFVSGEKYGANFLVTATTGGPLANVNVGIGYIATGY